MAGSGQPTAQQERALQRLVAQGRLDADQAQAVRTALWVDPSDRGTALALLIEVAGYVGGGLMLGGTGLLVGLAWRDLGRAGTTALLAGIAVAFTLAALLVAGGRRRLAELRPAGSTVRRRLTGVLLALVVPPAALAASVATDEDALLKGSIVALLVAAAGYGLLPTVPGLLATGAASLLAAYALVDASGVSGTSQPLTLSIAFVGVGLVWTVLALSHLTPPRHLALAVGAASAVLGGQLALAGPTELWGYGLTAAAAIGCFALYWFERATVVLAVGVLAATLAVPEAVSDWTDGALSGPAILLIAGAALVAASAVGVRLRTARSESTVDEGVAQSSSSTPGPH